MLSFFSQKAWGSGEIKYSEQTNKYYCGSHQWSKSETKGTTVEDNSDFGEVNPKDFMMLWQPHQTSSDAPYLLNCLFP